jgi:D-amino-acid dehydrogenase
MSSGGGPGTIVVIGGGIIGTACAHYLRQAGLAVTLIDQATIGSGCSHGNCGFVCPSHILPLAGPGAILRTLKTLFQRDSPLLIRPRFDLSLLSWFWRFAQRCNQRHMLESARGIQALLSSSRALYGDLFRSGQLDAEWQERGLLIVFRTPAEMNHYAHTDRLLSEQFNMPARRYESKDLIDLEPALKPGLAGAWHYPLDAHLRPDRLMSSWRTLLLANGVDICENCELLGFDTEGKRARAVRTSQGPLPADAVVVATGAWTPLLSRHLGCRLPIQPGKGYSITMPRPTRCPTIPLIFEEDRVAITPMQSGYRIGSTMEFAGYDSALSPRRLEILRKAARFYLHEPEAGPVQERWWGWRPMVPDGKPIIDRSPALGNVVIAAGHGMLGLSMAPATGKLVAEMLTGGTTPHVDPAAYSATRF